MLTALILVPVVGALAAALVPSRASVTRGIALAAALVELALAAIVFVGLDRGVSGFQMVERADWIGAFGIQYLVGVDGLSAPLVLLNGILGLAAVLASWRIEHRVREYFMWLLVLQAAVMGVFVSLDLILFFIFWELEPHPRCSSSSRGGERGAASTRR